MIHEWIKFARDFMQKFNARFQYFRWVNRKTIYFKINNKSRAQTNTLFLGYTSIVEKSNRRRSLNDILHLFTRFFLFLRYDVYIELSSRKMKKKLVYKFGAQLSTTQVVMLKLSPIVCLFLRFSHIFTHYDSVVVTVKWKKKPIEFNNCLSPLQR